MSDKFDEVCDGHCINIVLAASIWPPPGLVEQAEALALDEAAKASATIQRLEEERAAAHDVTTQMPGGSWIARRGCLMG